MSVDVLVCVYTIWIHYNIKRVVILATPPLNLCATHREGSPRDVMLGYMSMWLTKYFELNQGGMFGQPKSITSKSGREMLLMDIYVLCFRFTLHVKGLLSQC